METLTKEQERDLAEKCIKAKLDVKIIVANSPDYTFNKIIETMQEYALQMVAEKERRIKELEAELSESKPKNTFYCHDELINNACENWDIPKCSKQCGKCKAGF